CSVRFSFGDRVSAGFKFDSISEAVGCKSETSTEKVTKLLPGSACEELARKKVLLVKKRENILCKSPTGTHLWTWTKALPARKHFSQRLSVSPADRLFPASQSAQRRSCSCFRRVGRGHRRPAETSTRHLAPAAR